MCFGDKSGPENINKKYVEPTKKTEMMRVNFINGRI